MGFYSNLIEAVDVADLQTHDGDWQMYDIRTLREPVLINDTLHPRELGMVKEESAGQRSVPASGDAFELFTVASISAIGAGTTVLRLAFTQLWLTAS